MTGLPFRQAAFTELIGARVEEIGEGVCRLSLTVGPNHLDRHGVLHTGVLMSLMDASIGIALGYLRGDEVRHRPHATIEMNTSFLAEGQPGDEIEVEGRVIRKGRSIAFGEAEKRMPPALTSAMPCEVVVPATRHLVSTQRTMAGSMRLSCEAASAAIVCVMSRW